MEKNKCNCEAYKENCEICYPVERERDPREMIACLTEIIGRGMYSHGEVKTGVPIERINTDKWIDVYLDRKYTIRSEVGYNTFKPTIDKMVANIMHLIR